MLSNTDHLSYNEAGKLIELLIRSTSHELKNPLAAVKGYSQMIAQRSEDAAFVVKAGNKISEQIDRLDEMLVAIYRIFSLQIGEQSDFNYSDAFAEIRSSFENNNSNSIHVKTGDALSVHTDEQLFKRMFISVINGFDFEGKPDADIELSMSDGAFFICIRSAMNELNKENFFVPYYSKRYFKSGTELYEFFHIASLFGWKVDFENTGNSCLISVKPI